MDETIFNQRYIRRGTAANLPAFAQLGYLPGHNYTDTESGQIFTNNGHAGYSIHQRRNFNRFLLEEWFQYRPTLAADQLVPAADTYNTTQMQKVIQTNQNWKVVGTNSTSALCTLSTGGGVVLTTAGAANDQMIITPHTVAGVTAWTGTTWKTNQLLSFETTIQTGATITGLIIWAGLKLTNTPTVTTDNDQVYFRWQDTVNASRWEAVDSATNVDDETDTGVSAVTATTSYNLLIQVDGLLIPRYYINGALVRTGNALTTGIALIPFIGVMAISAAARVVTVRGVACGKSYTD